MDLRFEDERVDDWPERDEDIVVFGRIIC